MGQLSAEYFKRRDDLRQNGTNTVSACCAALDSAKQELFNSCDANTLLKEAFRTLCIAATNPSRHGLLEVQERFELQLQAIIP
jgi:hypothetical protein